ncbi:MAG: Sodium-dependent dicarboxylate transporter SdcS [Bacteroidia bacterium]|nr:Sodium-dependent dicarboxylate transporter SdcS [Bacteroidia bacterium]
MAAALIMLFVNLDPGNSMITHMAAITVWIAIWWLTEVVHLAVTSLLPFIFLPLLGICDAKTVAFQYMDQVIFLFIGGFIIAFAIERWNLHKRIALKILSLVGRSPASVLMGIMLTSYLISMWISNTATTMMLLSAVFAVVYQMEQHIKDEQQQHNIAAALFIGLAYSATIGGMATLVGTPPNMIFYRFYTETYPNNHDLDFLSWFKIGFPLSLAFLVVCFFVLKIVFLHNCKTAVLDKTYFRNEYKILGKMSAEEKTVGLIFIITALLWFTRSDIDIGSFKFPGWTNLFGKSEIIQDSTVAVFMALLLFIIPSKNEKSRALITWHEASKLPFDIILLFGSGFAIAKGFEVSGLSSFLASQLTFFKTANIVVIILLICIMITIISEFASNIASIQLALPVLISIQKGLDIHPLLLMIPATFAASLGFMLPVATAPNTIVFGSKRIKVNDMMKAGFFLDLTGILLIVLFSLILLC